MKKLGIMTLSVGLVALMIFALSVGARETNKDGISDDEHKAGSTPPADSPSSGIAPGIAPEPMKNEDIVSAAEFRKEADQGDAIAQFNLGNRYHEGKGVAKDVVVAYMWVNLAATSGNENARKLRELLEKEMTVEQLSEAQRLSRDWKPRPHLNQGE